MGINVLSLFNGKNGGLTALKKAGIKVKKYYASEIDVDAIKISDKNHPETINLGNVMDWEKWSLPKIDLIIAGSPCQGFSRQGKGLNFEDPRSSLFFVFVKVLNYYKMRNPDIKFMLENVDMKREWEDVITDYVGVKPYHINSNLLVPQNRPRTYWSNLYFSEPVYNGNKLTDILEDVVLDEFEIIEEYKVSKEFNEKSIDLISVVDGDLRIKQATKLGYIVAEVGDGINLSFPTSKTRRGRVTKGKSGCLDTSCELGVLDQYKQIRRFTINELERLQGLEEGYTEGVSEASRKRMLGNGWTVDVVAHIFRGLSN